MELGEEGPELGALRHAAEQGAGQQGPGVPALVCTALGQYQHYLEDTTGSPVSSEAFNIKVNITDDPKLVDRTAFLFFDFIFTRLEAAGSSFSKLINR